MGDWIRSWLALKWLGVELEVIATSLGTALAVVGLVGWVQGFRASRLLQGIVACLVLGPGGTAFAMNQFGLGAWWSWVIGTGIGLAGLPFVARAASRAPDVVDAGLDAAIDKARGVLGRLPGDKPGGN